MGSFLIGRWRAFGGGNSNALERENVIEMREKRRRERREVIANGENEIDRESYSTVL